MTPTKLADHAAASDNEIVQRILGGEIGLYEILIRRYNRRLYRIARAILRDEHEAEDVVQEAYVRAYEHLAQYEGRALFSTWLTKIAVYEAWNRMRRFSRQEDFDAMKTFARQTSRLTRTPEADLLTKEARYYLESAIDNLPETYRSVFVMRALEDMSTAETAKCLDISEEAVKVRLSRARRVLRHDLYERALAAGSGAFEFLGEACDRVTANVLARIR